ncbi:MAG: YeeE/YedE family protein [Treponema sp.]
MKKIENLVGFALLLASIAFGAFYLKNLGKEVLFLRWLIGIGIGYLLTRAFFGFAGSANRAYRTGSTKLMRILMFMFALTAILNAGLFVLNGGPEGFRMSVHPINIGLVVGGLLFGIGMAFCSCCASGSLTDIVTALPRGGITLLFMCIGVFVGFPFQKNAAWVKDSLIAPIIHRDMKGMKGVWLPDLFSSETSNGFLGAILLTILFASIVIVLSYLYERKRKQSNTFSGVGAEIEQDKLEEFDVKNYKFLSAENYSHIFSKPWTLATGAVTFAVLFALLMGFAKTGWGVTTAFGIWFGRLLKLFGVSAESLAAFTGRNVSDFTDPFFKNATTVQDVGIIVGTIISLLLAGTFSSTCKSELKTSFMDIIVYAIGGFIMGIGTRFANGCNAGALFTPIVQFSLSGWLYLIFVTTGGIIGNMILKAMKRL